MKICEKNELTRPSKIIFSPEEGNLDEAAHFSHKIISIPTVFSLLFYVFKTFTRI